MLSAPASSFMACLSNLLPHLDGCPHGAIDGGPLPVPLGLTSSISNFTASASTIPTPTYSMLSFTDAGAPHYHVVYSSAIFAVPPLHRAHPGATSSASVYKHLYPDDILSMMYVKRAFYRTEILALTYVIVDEPVGRRTHSMFGTIVKPARTICLLDQSVTSTTDGPHLRSNREVASCNT